MDWPLTLLAILFSLFGAGCVIGIAGGLPGIWLLIAGAALVELAGPALWPVEKAVFFGWPLLGLCVLLGLAGEAIEAVAGAAGTRAGGGTRRGMAGAIAGGILGAILFSVLLPVPIAGTLLGSLLGTFAGAFAGEATAARARGHARNLRAALAATAGRLAGTLAKMALACVALALCVRALLRA